MHRNSFIKCCCRKKMHEYSQCYKSHHVSIQPTKAFLEFCYPLILSTLNLPMKFLINLIMTTPTSRSFVVFPFHQHLFKGDKYLTIMLQNVCSLASKKAPKDTFSWTSTQGRFSSLGMFTSMKTHFHLSSYPPLLTLTTPRILIMTYLF